MRATAAALALTLACAGCGAPTAAPAPARQTGTQAAVDPAALYCMGTGGTVVARTAGGRRADLCRTADGRTVSAADLLNSHNDL